MNEKTILCLVAKGDENAFQELYENYRNKVFYIAWKLLRSKDNAEDVLQEIFIKIWTHKEKLPDIENFNAYLNTLIRNHIYNCLRKQANEENFILEAAKQDINDSNLTFDTVLLHELQHKLQSAVYQLSPQQKRVFELSRLEGFTHKEIAEMMNISKETVKKHMMEASRLVKTVSFYTSIGL
jgi:RNA polymerase sigma-70 factor (ECF subfamily)